MYYAKLNKAKCYICFDYDNDKTLKDFLIGQSKNEDSPFEISDWSIKESGSDCKDEARTRIRRSDIVIVLCGKHTDTATGVSVELSIAQEEKKDYFLLAGYSNGGNKKPKSVFSHLIMSMK